MSPDGARTAHLFVNGRRDHPDFLCIGFTIVDGSGAEEYAVQTVASDRMRWSFEWKGNDRVVLESSDIGTLEWFIGDDSKWVGAEPEEDGGWREIRPQQWVFVSPDGVRTAHLFLNRQRNHPTFGCVGFRILDSSGTVEFAVQTWASDRMRWSFEWKGNDRVVLRSQYIRALGPLEWFIGEDGKWTGAEAAQKGRWRESDPRELQ